MTSTAMMSVRRHILPKTPIKRTSLEKIRKRLYATPTSTPASSPVALASITITSRAGIMVKHIEDNSERANTVGVILKQTTGEATETLDVLWTEDGVTTAVEPAKLKDNTATMPTPASSPEVSIFPHEKSFYEGRSKSYKRLLPDKLPEGLLCPLESSDPAEIEQFKEDMDNFLSAGHPKIRQLILGNLVSPLLTFKPYIDYMTDKASPAAYVFEHSTADYDIAQMRTEGKFELAESCEIAIDNLPFHDGFRPLNCAVFYSLLKSIKGFNYALRDITHGDGIGLRNQLWDMMADDHVRSKKLMAINMASDIHDVKYKFERHGVKKYFADIHKSIAKLNSLGAVKQDWEIFGLIFSHMEQQCEEYRQVVVALREKLSNNDNALSLKLIEATFQRKESVHRIGTDNKGTPINAPVAMNRVPNITAARAKTTPQTAPDGKPPLNPQRSKKWPEDLAEKNYGASGSHEADSCKCTSHEDCTGQSLRKKQNWKQAGCNSTLIS